MTPRQARFVAEYMVDMNGTQAAVRAGYSAKTAEAQASRLLRNVKVGAALTAAKAKLAERLEISSERIASELAKLGFANMADYMQIGADGQPALNFAALSRDQAAALVEVTVEEFKDGRGDGSGTVRRVKFKLADKRASLVDLGRHVGMFIDRTESVNRTYVISAEPVDDPEAWAQEFAPRH